MSLEDIRTRCLMPRRCQICKKFKTEFYITEKPNGKLIKLCTICHLVSIINKNN